MDVNDILKFNTQILFIALSIFALVDYARRGGKRRRDFFLFAFALGFPLSITFARRFTPLQSGILDLAGAYALFSQPYLLYRLLQYFRASRTGIGLLILAGFLLCCLLPLSGMTSAKITIIFSYCAVAEACATWGFYQEIRDTSGTLRRRLTIITVSSGVFTIAFLINAIKAQFPSLGITPLAQIAAAISAILFYVAFIPPRWLRRAWQREDLQGYIAQVKNVSTTTDFVIESLQQLSQTAKQLTTGLAAGVLKVDPLTPERAILAATDQGIFGRLAALDPAFIQQAWESRRPAYQLTSKIVDANQREGLNDLGAQTWLLVPIHSQDYLAALLIVALRDRSLFMDDDLALLELLTLECVLILDNHRLTEELRGSSESWAVEVKQRRERMSVLSRYQQA